MKEKTSITSSLSNKGSLTDAEINAGFGFNTILKSPDLNGQLYDIDSQVDIITKEICNFLTGNGVTINSGDNSQLATLMSSLLSAKQNTLVAGTGITIDENGVISAQASTPANIPLFYCTWLDSLPFNVSWVNANNYSWLYGSTYVGAYNRLKSQLNPVGTFSAGDTYYVCNFSDGSMQTTTVLIGGATVAQLEAWCSAQGYTYSGATIEEFKCYKTVSASSETIEGITITYYQTNDGKKIVTSDAEIANAESIYNATGVQWYYILDITNQRFKLPRTKWGFTGLRGAVGKYVPESAPNIKGSFQVYTSNNYPDEVSGAFTVEDSQNSGESYKLLGKAPIFKFDASQSSSTYQDNAPVQQRATQMYLYFYLGSSDVEEIAEIAGIKAETINNKADRDLNNVSRNLLSGYEFSVVQENVVTNQAYSLDLPYTIDCSKYKVEAVIEFKSIVGNFEVGDRVPLNTCWGQDYRNISYWYNNTKVGFGSSDQISCLSRGTSGGNKNVASYIRVIFEFYKIKD